LLSAAKFVLGNSSSGLLEAPSFGIPTLNIGPRQNGRPKANSVIDLECEESEIIDGIDKITTEAHLSTQLSIENPYGNPGASLKIVDILEACNFEGLLPKRFTDAN
jgi:UDP-N-acetylglucosamine 2-epimerase